eukprot:COSAG01_NODE_11257_length_1971_cov_2.328526_4_plen_94_part_00
MHSSMMGTRTSKTFPQGAEHWSLLPGIQSGGHLPPAQPERQAGSLLMAESLTNTELMLHSLVLTCFGGTPPAVWAWHAGSDWARRTPRPPRST